MISFRPFIVAFVAGAAVIAVPAARQRPLEADGTVLADFARRVGAYMSVRAAAADTVLPLVPLRDPAEIRRRTDALATVIQSARWNARQGDIFTPEIAAVIRAAIRGGC